MSELKELAFEAAARGSPSGIVLVVFLIIGGIVQQQAPPSSPGTQNVFVETRLICPSLLSETALEKALPRAMARKSEDDDSNRSVRKKSTNGTLQLPEFAVPLLSSLLQLVPAAGLAKQGYEEFKSGTRLLGTPWLCLATGNNGPLIRLAVVHLLGQAGTFGASQLARFAGTRPGQTFFDRCGHDSATLVCKRAARENLKVVQLIPDLELVSNQTGSSSTSTQPPPATSEVETLWVSEANLAAPNTTEESGSRGSEVSASAELRQAEYDYYVYEERAEVPVLCQNSASSFSDLFKSLHENPKFSSGSFGAAVVALLFGLRLLSQVRRRRKRDAPFTDEPSRVSPRAACLWTLTEALAFLVAAVSALALLINFHSWEINSGSDLLLSVSLGVAVQLSVVLWSSYGNLFFDVRHLRDLAWSAKAAAAAAVPEPTAVRDGAPFVATSIGQ
jgi:hypothetical protein